MESPRQVSPHRPDYLGAVMVTVALAALALGISQSEVWGWPDGRTLSALAVVLVVVPVFLARQRRHPEPVIDLSLFQQRSFAVANVSTLLFMLGFSAMALNNVLFLRTAWRYSVLQAGMASALAPVVVAIVSGPAGKLASPARLPTVAGRRSAAVQRRHRRRAITLLGSTPNIGRWLLFGVVMASASAARSRCCRRLRCRRCAADRFGVGGAVNTTARQVGAVLGVAILVAVQGCPTTLPRCSPASATVGGWSPAPPSPRR